MDARKSLPISPHLATQMKSLERDLQRARINLVQGHLAPDHYAKLSKILETRLRELEVEVHVRVLERARGSGAWQPKGHRAG